MARNLTVLALALTSACGGEFERSLPSSSEDVEGRVGAGLVAAHVLPRAVLEEGASLMSVALDAALFVVTSGATILTGRLEQLDSNEWRHMPNEEPWLTVVPLDGPQVRLRYRSRRLPFFDTAKNVLARDHLVIIDVEVSNQIYLSISSSRQGDRVQSEVRGTFAYRDEPVRVDIAAAGIRRSEVDSTGSSSLLELTTKGTLVGIDFHIETQEGFRAETVTSGGDSASSSISTLAPVVEIEGRRFRFEDVRIQRNFRDAKPNDESFWRAGGQIMAGREVAGAYRLDTEFVDGEGRFILVVLDTADGPLELERWQAF